MTLDDLIPSHVTSAVATLGLHKVAGAMLGVPELDFGTAVRALGERAYLRRKEARAVLTGIAALSSVTKTAEVPATMWEVGRRALFPAATGALIGALPALTAATPTYDQLGNRLSQPSPLSGALAGAALGGVAGAGNALRSATLRNPGIDQALSTALKNL